MSAPTRPPGPAERATVQPTESAEDLSVATSCAQNLEAGPGSRTTRSRGVTTVLGAYPATEHHYWRQGATRLGIPFEEYRHQVESGNRWCSYHRVWEPRGWFGTQRNRRDGLATLCVDGERAAARTNMAILRARRKEAAS